MLRDHSKYFRTSVRDGEARPVILGVGGAFNIDKVKGVCNTCFPSYFLKR